METTERKANKILIAHLNIDGYDEFYISYKISAKAISSFALNHIVLDKEKITPELSASCEQKVTRGIRKVDREENALAKLDTRSLSPTSTLFLFKQEVFSCGDNCELKSGDKITLLYPEPCLDFYDTHLKESDYVVAIKYDAYFSPEKACDIFLANTTYPLTRQMRQNYLEYFKNVHWKELVAGECVLSELLEVAFVEMA